MSVITRPDQRMKLLKAFGLERLEYLSYSPNLATSGFCLFGPLKRITFDDEDAAAEVTLWSREQTETFDVGFQGLVNRKDTYLKAHADHVEKKNSGKYSQSFLFLARFCNLFIDLPSYFPMVFFNSMLSPVLMYF